MCASDKHKLLLSAPLPEPAGSRRWRPSSSTHTENTRNPHKLGDEPYQQYALSALRSVHAVEQSNRRAALCTETCAANTRRCDLSVSMTAAFLVRSFVHYFEPFTFSVCAHNHAHTFCVDTANVRLLYPDFVVSPAGFSRFVMQYFARRFGFDTLDTMLRVAC